ncbi:putative DP-E2F-like 1 [Hibiscus syriacus]|uniref:DP-E2F-like 1 n=1 Tax=Hibiscus syriacus TaxID=106335 RepID=A0A6A2XRU6_HIBSY|nr:putative DP-E2F-like 1 [Hibiscus syriacus]
MFPKLMILPLIFVRIEPLDNSVVSKGVSDSAKESMKRTISTMLGILSSDQFSISVSISKPPLHRLLFSYIVTGYTLWNAEYRVSLTMNLERTARIEETAEETEEAVSRRQGELFEEKREERASQSDRFQKFEKIGPRIFGYLSPEALKYFQKLQAELCEAEEVRILDFICVK